MRTTYALATLSSALTSENIRERKAWEEKFLMVDANSSALLKDRAVRYNIDFKSYNDALTVSEYLQNNL